MNNTIEYIPKSEHDEKVAALLEKLKEAAEEIRLLKEQKDTEEEPINTEVYLYHENRYRKSFEEG